MKALSIKIIMVFSLFITLIWIYGLVWTMNDQFHPKKNNIDVSIQGDTKIENKNQDYTIFAFGDSLTRGTGDQSGKGYVGDIVDELKSKTKQKINLTNASIKGQTSSQLVQQIQQPEIQRQMMKANVILLTIGGNDLFHEGEAIFNVSQKELELSKQNYLKNLNEIFTIIRHVNTNAEVFHIGLYNPFIELDNQGETSKIIREWNHDAAEVAAEYKKVVYVPTFDLFELHMNDYLYDDKFHPNQEGYQLIAERVASLLSFQKEAGE